jgi:hypothetical protein
MTARKTFGVLLTRTNVEAFPRFSEARSNGPDTILTGDLLYWDLPDDDKESRSITKGWRHLKTRPVEKRRTVLLRKYDPEKQGMRRKAIRSTNDAVDDKLASHLRGGTDAFHKSQVDIVDCLKKVFLLGMVAKDAVLEGGLDASTIRARVAAQDGAIADAAERLGLHMTERGVHAGNRAVHDAFLSMIAPKNRAELMYDPSKRRLAPTSPGGQYTRGEKVLKHINVLEQLLCSQAVGQHDISSRIVARALSSGKTGSDIDIVEFVQ